MEDCPQCRKRGKDWEGDDPRCAFRSGVFSEDNWNCATLNALRSRSTWSNHDDFANANLGVINIPENDTVQGYAVLSWYKSRGRTGQAWIFWDDEEPHRMTLSEANAILAALPPESP